MPVSAHPRPVTGVALDRDRRHVRRSVHPGAFRRRRWPWLVAGGAALLFGLMTFQAYRIALYTAEDLKSAAVVLKVGPQFLVGDSPFSDEVYGRVRGSIDRAIERVHHANWSFGLVGAVPMLGRPVHAAEHLVRAAAIELDSIDLARRTVADMTGRDGARPLVQHGEVNLDSLRAAAATLNRILDDLSLVEAEVRAVRPIPFAGGAEALKQQALHELARVRTSAGVIRHGLEVLPDFFGANGPRLYLLAILNPAELHGVGGAFLSYGVVKANRGRLSLIADGDPLPLDPRNGPGTGVPPPPDNYYLSHIYPVRLVNALNGPDFAQGARLASDIVRAKFGTPLDGVIAIDAVGLSYVLPAVGPIRFPERRIILNAQNFVRFSTNAQYLLYPYEIRQRIQQATVEQVWGRIGSVSNPLALLGGLSTGLLERRVLLWSRFPPEQQLFQSRDWAGRVFKPRGDYFLLNHQNLGVDKLDYYLREQVDYNVHVLKSGELDVRATLTLRNTARPGLPKPVGNNAASQMRTLLGEFVPQGARVVGLDVQDDNRSVPSGPRDPRIEVGYGKRLFLTILKIDAKSRAVVTIHYRVPGGLVHTADGTFYNLMVQHQPLVHPAEMRFLITPPPGRRFELPPGWVISGNGVAFGVRLDRDLRLSLRLR